MSNQYFQDISYKNDQYNNSISYNNNPLNPIYKEPIKRDTIYENVKVNKPIVLSPGDNSYFQNVNYNNNDNLYSKYQTSIYNDINKNNYFAQTTTEINNNDNLYSEYQTSNYNNINKNNYFAQTTTEFKNNDNLYSEYQTSNYNDFNNNNYFTQTTNELNNNDNLYPQYQINNNNIDINNNKYFKQTTTEIISENNLENYFNGTYGNKTIIDLNNNENFSNTYSYSNNYNQPMIIKNQIKNIEYQTVQNITPKKIEFAQIKKLTDNKNINKFNNIPQNINNFIKAEKQIKNEPIKEKAIVQRIKEDNDENINKIKEENKPKISPNIPNKINNIEIKNLPGPAKISKISNGYIPLNPRVRFAKEEKKINIVKLSDDNDKNNNINNNIINNININDKIEKVPEVKKEEEIIKIGLKNENLINKENNMNNNIIMNNEPKKEIKKEEITHKEPNDDYNSKKLDNKFHKVRILKKSPSEELFPHTNLLDIGDYVYLSDENKNKKQKVNIIYLNDKKNDFKNKEGLNQFIDVKKIIPKNIHEKQNELFKKSQDNLKDNINNNGNRIKKQYENIKDNNKKEDNSNDNEDIVESHEDSEFNDDEVKDSDEIYNKKRIKEDSNIKKNINNDGLDEFDNNFNEHDKFYKKMKYLLDEELN